MDTCQTPTSLTVLGHVLSSHKLALNFIIFLQVKTLLGHKYISSIYFCLLYMFEYMFILINILMPFSTAKNLYTISWKMQGSSHLKYVFQNFSFPCACI